MQQILVLIWLLRGRGHGKGRRAFLYTQGRVHPSDPWVQCLECNRCAINIHGRVKDERVKGRERERLGTSIEAEKVVEEEGRYKRKGISTLICLDKPSFSLVGRNLWILRVMHSLPLLVLRIVASCTPPFHSLETAAQARPWLSCWSHFSLALSSHTYLLAIVPTQVYFRLKTFTFTFLSA